MRTDNLDVHSSTALTNSANLKIDGLTKPGSVVLGTRAMEGQKVNEKKTDISDRPWDLR